MTPNIIESTLELVLSHHILADLNDVFFKNTIKVLKVGLRLKISYEDILLSLLITTTMGIKLKLPKLLKILRVISRKYYLRL